MSAVREVVAQAGPAPSCAPCDPGLVAGGESPPGADLADVDGGQQQRGEDGLGGDAADAAPAGLGEGLVGGVFGVAVEAFDGVPQGGIPRVPGRAAVGQVLAVAGAGVRGDGDRRLGADPGRFGRLWVPRTSSTSCDQAVFVDHATDASVPSDTVLLKIDRFG